MPALSQNIKVWRGDTKSLVIPVTNDAGAAYDMVGATAHYWMGYSARQTDVILFKHSGVGGTLTIATNNVTIPLTAADTDMRPGIYYHELKVTKAGVVATAMTGAFVVRAAQRLGAYRIVPDDLETAPPVLGTPAAT